MASPKIKHDSFSLERKLPHAVGKVFAAWSNDAVRRRWFVEGEGWVILDYRFDFRSGGSEGGRFRREDSSNVISNDTFYQNIIENEQIVFAYTMRVDGNPLSASLSTVEFMAEDSGTRLRVTEQIALLDGSDSIAERREGWEFLLGRMAEEVAATR